MLADDQIVVWYFCYTDNKFHKLSVVVVGLTYREQGYLPVSPNCRDYLIAMSGGMLGVGVGQGNYYPSRMGGVGTKR